MNRNILHTIQDLLFALMSACLLTAISVFLLGYNNLYQNHPIFFIGTVIVVFALIQMAAKQNENRSLQ